MGNCPRTTHHLLGYRHCQRQWASSFYCERLDAQFDRYLINLFQDHGFSLSRLATGHSPTTNVQRGLAAPSFVLLALPFSSPCPNVNGGIDLLTIGSLECLTLRLPQTIQMWKGESIEV